MARYFIYELNIYYKIDKLTYLFRFIFVLNFVFKIIQNLLYLIFRIEKLKFQIKLVQMLLKFINFELLLNKMYILKFLVFIMNIKLKAYFF